jgi:hypothetical protein
VENETAVAASLVLIVVKAFHFFISVPGTAFHSLTYDVVEEGSWKG